MLHWVPHAPPAHTCALPQLVPSPTLLHTEVLLPGWLSGVPGFREGVDFCLRGPFEQLFCNIYNESDGLVVLSDGLKKYWTERGVKVPVHVIPRAVSLDVFAGASREDPYAELLARAGLAANSTRLVCAGRHTREKAQDRAIQIFASRILPAAPNTVLFSPSALAIQLAPALVTVALVLFVIGGGNLPGYIKRTLHHPMLVGVILWSSTHLLANGGWRETVLFGSFLVFSVYALCSLLLAGKLARFVPAWKWDAIGLAIGLFVAIGVMHSHKWLFGVAVT